MKRDFSSKPFKKLVALGESHTVGISASRKELGWAPILKDLIDQFQEKPVTFVNHGIGADVLSKKCPMYRDYQGERPIGIERYRKHVIDEKPDLVVISYGLNDFRAGTPLAAFERDLSTMVADIQKPPRSVIVLLDTYFIPGKGFDHKTGGTEVGRAWHYGNKTIQLRFNKAIKRVAKRHDVLFAPISEAQGDAEWMVCTPSGNGDIHANDLGHRVIGNKVFEVLANNCSGISKKALKDRKQAGKSLWRFDLWKPGADCRWEDKLKRDFYPDFPAKFADRSSKPKK